MDFSSRNRKAGKVFLNSDPKITWQVEKVKDSWLKPKNGYKRLPELFLNLRYSV